MKINLEGILAICSFLLSIWTVGYLRRSTRATEIQAQAAKTAALAAENQAKLAIEAAEDAKCSIKLYERTLKASLRPILQIERRPHDLRDPTNHFVNRGQGMALKINARFGSGVPPAEIAVPSTLAPNSEYKLGPIDWGRAIIDAVYLFYESEDGRKFRTTIICDSQTYHAKCTHEESS